MNYEIFQEMIISRLDWEIPDPKKILIRKFTRINGQQLDGLIIMEDGINISPAIYLNPYYEFYQNGREFSDILDEILSVYQRNRPAESVDGSFFTNFSNIRNRVVYKIINYRLNKPLLEEIPHFRFLDLAVVFYCLLTADPAGNASILIRNEHLKYWNASPEDLYELAKINTPLLLPYDLQNMGKVIENMAPEEYEEYMEESPLYVLTNNRKMNGACCILYRDLLKSISQKLNSDFYILPSSVHEVLLLPSGDNSSIKEFSGIVKDVNDLAVADEEVLSGHAYYYSRKDNCVSM